MKVNIQTLKNAKHILDVQPTDTILSVKQKISTELQLGAVDEQKLIFVGKILANDQTVAAANITEGANIVIMVTKKKATATPATASAPAPAPVASQTTEQPAAAPAPATTETPAVTPATAPESATTTPAAQPAAAAAAPAASATSSLATGPVYEEAVTNLMSFGFPREQVQQAMRAAFNNADRAAEYLFSGIPAGALAQAEAASQRPTATPAAAPAAPAAGAGAGAGSVDLSALGDLTQLRTLLASNPQMLPALLSQLAQSHPEMLQQLEDNPEAFIELMQALGIDPNSLPGMQALQAGGGGVDEQGRHVIQITEEEQAQINNLISFGFPRDAVIEAWLLCERDPEMAAAYLLEHAGELVGMGDDHQFVGGDNMDEQGDDDEEDFDPSQYME